MRTGSVVLGVAVALVCAQSTWSAPSLGAYHVACARRALSAGDQVEVKLEPAPPPGTRVYWRNAQQVGMNPAAVEACRAVYTAPFVIPAGSPPASIRVDLSGPETGRIGFTGQVDLEPSALPGTADCLGPGQSFSTDYGAIEPSDGQLFSRMEPVIVHMNDPEYPQVAVKRGLTDQVPVLALLCRSGRVLAAHLQNSYSDNREPIEREPALIEAALAITQSRTFAPVLRDGQPVAGWIHVDVAFRP